jgi:uncharacterized coiled-coil DUF342 family protein
MDRGKKALLVAVVLMLGAWGCAKGPGINGSSSAERIKALEFKVAQLQEDFQTAAAARDQVQEKVTAMEKDLALLRKERDDLRKQLATRTGERDALHTQYEQFRKAIRDVLGQAEARASIGISTPVTADAVAQAPGKS